MGLRLTLLLLAGLFLAMYFAPAAPPPDRSAVAVPDVPAPAPMEAPTEPAMPRAAPSEPPPVVALPSATDPVAPQPQTRTDDLAPADLSARDDDAPLSLPGLAIGGAFSDAAEALALSDAVRERAEAARAATDTLLQELARTPASEPLAETGSAPLGDTVGDAGGEAVADTASTALPEPTSPIPPPQERRALVTGSTVNLRAGPSTDNGVVGQVDFGQEVVLTGPFNDGWASVVNPDTGQEAFMASRFLQIQP